MTRASYAATKRSPCLVPVPSCPDPDAELRGGTRYGYEARAARQSAFFPGPRFLLMKWRKILMSGGAALGAAAAFNHMANRDVGPLENLIGGTEGWFQWRGHRVAYTVRGQGTPVLLVHGVHTAASSYEWRSNVDVLARTHTVYTIDLLGFGRSDRPTIRYTPALFLGLLSDFARQIVAAPCTIIASSLAAAYAIVLGARDPGRFPALVLVAPVGVVRLNQNPRASGEFTRIAVDTPVVGTAVFNGLVSRRSIRAYLEASYAD